MRVVLADDSVLLREGIARLLKSRGIDVVAQAGTLDEVLDQARRFVPDVVIVDIRMPPRHLDEGIVATREIRRELGPGVGVLVLSQYVEPELARLVVAAADGGGLGYILKDRVRDVDELVDALRRTAEGGIVIDPSLVAQLIGATGRQAMQELSQRERDVLRLMAEGRSNRAIADRLYVTERTVEAHIANIFSKLLLEPVDSDHRRVLAVLAYLGIG